jgi:hypothetical protein
MGARSGRSDAGDCEPQSDLATYARKVALALSEPFPSDAEVLGETLRRVAVDLVSPGGSKLDADQNAWVVVSAARIETGLEALADAAGGLMVASEDCAGDLAPLSDLPAKHPSELHRWAGSLWDLADRWGGLLRLLCSMMRDFKLPIQVALGEALDLGEPNLVAAVRGKVPTLGWLHRALVENELAMLDSRREEMDGWLSAIEWAMAKQSSGAAAQTDYPDGLSAHGTIWLTPSEVATLLGKSRATVTDAARDGLIVGHQRNGKGSAWEIDAESAAKHWRSDAADLLVRIAAERPGSRTRGTA